MKSIVPVLVAIAAICSTGCSSLSVSAYKAPTANMTTYKTFAWATGEGASHVDSLVQHDYVPGAVESAIEEAMAAKGYTKADSADILVGYHVAINEKLNVETVRRKYDYGYAPQYMYRPGTSSWEVNQVDMMTNVEPYELGSVVVDLVDAKSNEVVWRGTVQSKVDRAANRAEREARIQNAIKRLFEQL